MPNKVVVVGGAGFIGTRLCKRLELTRRDFAIFDLKGSQEYPEKSFFCDVRDRSSFSDFDGCNVLVNLAAEHRDDVKPSSLYEEVNIGGAQIICDLAREFEIPTIIFTSSVAVYGFAPPNTSEDGDINYFNEYGRSKFLAEKVYREWQSEAPSKRALVVIRPTVVFGEGNRGNVYNLFRQIASGRFVMIGNGLNVKSMAYVENVAAFIEKCFLAQSGLHLYNYVDKPDLDMKSLVCIVRKILFGKSNVGLKIPAWVGISIGLVVDVAARLTRKSYSISRIRVKKFISTTQFDSSIEKSTFEPPISLEEGLKRTIAYDIQGENGKDYPELGSQGP